MYGNPHLYAPMLSNYGSSNYAKYYMFVFLQVALLVKLPYNYSFLFV